MKYSHHMSRINYAFMENTHLLHYLLYRIYRWSFCFMVSTIGAWFVAYCCGGYGIYGFDVFTALALSYWYKKLSFLLAELPLFGVTDASVARVPLNLPNLVNESLVFFYSTIKKDVFKTKNLYRFYRFLSLFFLKKNKL